MDKEEFIKKVTNNLEDISLEKAKHIITKLCSKMPSELYDISSSIIEDVTGNTNISYEEITKKLEDLTSLYKQIEDGKICFKCYSYQSGYGPFGDDYDYEYLSSGKINSIINETYNFGKKLVYHKQYSKAIEVFDLILYSNYICEEVGNPEYDTTDEVYDSFDIDIMSVKEVLDFDLDYVYLYAIYSILISNYPDKNNKIYKYLSDNNHVKIKDSLDLGIEQIKGFDKFKNEWIKFLENKNDDKSKTILKNSLD